MNDTQIKHMVDRFLSMKLPADFSPDAGITFVPTFMGHGGHPMKHEPSGTNLFSAAQMTEIVKHMTDKLPLE